VSLVPQCGTVADPRVYVSIALGCALIVAFVLHALRRTDHPLIDLRLLANRNVASANATRFLFAVMFFGTGLLFPGYFQQVLGKTPFQSGLLLVPQTIGTLAVLPIVGRLMEKRGPRRIVFAGLIVIIAGIAVFTYGISQYRVHIPVLLVGLAMFGIGTGCLSIPVSWTALHTVNKREAAHRASLFNVNHNTSAAIGAALMSAILTSQSNRVTDGSSRAYVVVFMAALMLMACTFIPASLLPNKIASNLDR